MFTRSNIVRSGACAIAAAAIAFAAAAQHPDPQLFDSPWIGYDTGVYPEGLNPMDSVTADFNADGIADLATVSWGGTAYLSILFGDGNGGYLPHERYELLLESLGLVAFDWDQDGDLDIAVTDTDRFWAGISISIWENDGEGGFSFFAWFDMNNHGPSGITAADFDGDGWIDLATANDAYITCNNTVSVMRNNQGQGFHPAQVYVVSSCTNEITSGDVDGDGHPDLVVAHESNRWTLMLNNQEGGFTVTGVFPGIVSGSIPADPIAHLSDIDLDGDLDVFYSQRDSGGVSEGAIGLWHNNGDGTFVGPTEMSFDWYTTGGVDINTGDVSEDGWPDILAANSSGNWFLFESTGGGDFMPARRLRAGQATTTIELPDLNLDGALDVVVVAEGSLEACVYLNPGAGAFVQPEPLDFADPNIAPAFTTNVEAGDLDMDGDLDLVVGFRSDFSSTNGITVRRNNGDGTFGPRETYSETLYPGWLDLADMDGDGDLDILYFNADNRFFIRKNNGSGSFDTRLARHVFSGSNEAQILAIDVDDDGDLDVVKNAAFSLQVSRNLGNDNYGAPYTAADVGGSFGTFAFGDFTGDGILDLLTDSAAQGYPQISFGLGNGFYGQPMTVPTGRDVHSFGVADLDHDGALDFTAIYNLDEKGVTLRRGRGDGNFFLPNHYHGSYQSGDYTTGGTTELVDIDGDGFEDVLFANVLAQDFTFWKNNGDGTLQELVRYGAGHNVYDMAAGDYNGDGLIDIAMATQIDSGRWWYTGVVIINGLDPGAGAGQSAPMSDYSFAFGSQIAGDAAALEASDDVYVQGRSQFGFSAQEPNIIDLVTGFESPVASPAGLTFTIEARLNNPGGSGKVRIRNWTSGTYEQIGTFSSQQSDAIETFENIDPSNRVRGSDRRVELSTRVSVIATFSASGFDAWFDQAALAAHE